MRNTTVLPAELPPAGFVADLVVTHAVVVGQEHPAGHAGQVHLVDPAVVPHLGIHRTKAAEVNATVTELVPVDIANVKRNRSPCRNGEMRGVSHNDAAGVRPVSGDRLVLALAGVVTDRHTVDENVAGRGVEQKVSGVGDDLSVTAAHRERKDLELAGVLVIDETDATVIAHRRVDEELDSSGLALIELLTDRTGRVPVQNGNAQNVLAALRSLNGNETGTSGSAGRSSTKCGGEQRRTQVVGGDAAFDERSPSSTKEVVEDRSKLLDALSGQRVVALAHVMPPVLGSRTGLDPSSKNGARNRTRTRRSPSTEKAQLRCQ